MSIDSPEASSTDPAPESGSGTPSEPGAAESGAAAAPGGRPRAHKRRRRFHGAVGWGAVIVFAIILAVLLRQFVIQTFYVPSSSMEPTLRPGDRMLVLKTGFSLQEGAVVVFKTPPSFRPADCGGAPESDFVKRIIGLPGETIWSVGNSVYINGKRLSEPYLPKNQPLGRPIPRQTIPANEYFMMGDNRPVSCDSRIWGDVPRRNIIGRVIAVIWRGGHPVLDVI